LMSNLPCA
jgi:lipoprotein-anchoring transpeptidase ErfK/SrfK